MLKKLNNIHLALLIIILLFIPVVYIFYGWDSPNLFIAVLVCLLLAHPILYLVMMLIKEAKVLEYDTPKYAPICMGITIILGCIIWYGFFHLDFIFIHWISFWYGAVLIAFSLPIVVCQIISRILEKRKNSNGPKFIKK